MNMKKILIACITMMLMSASCFAQKYALIDMDYILKKIPQYEMANEQLENRDPKLHLLYKKYQEEHS